MTDTGKDQEGVKGSSSDTILKLTFLPIGFFVYPYVCVCMYAYVYMCVYVYVYIHLLSKTLL